MSTRFRASRWASAAVASVARSACGAHAPARMTARATAASKRRVVIRLLREVMDGGSGGVVSYLLYADGAVRGSEKRAVAPDTKAMASSGTALIKITGC